MDLRQPLFRHPHARYGNVLQPADFIPQPYTHHLLPLPSSPPEPHPPRFLLPPPPPPPILPRHIAHPPLSPRFTFSPPRHTILDRSHLYEIDPPRKPYFHHDLVPPPPPPPPPLPPPRENIPLRFIHDYPDRNPIFRDEKYRQGYNDKYIHELPEIWERDLRRDAREIHTRVPHVGDHERYCEIFHQSRDLHTRRDDDEIWDNGTNNWGRDLYNERDYNERRWDSGINEQCRELYYERDYDQKRWGSAIIEQGLQLYNDRNYEERRWGDGINNLGREFYREGYCSERRWDYGSNDGILLPLESRQREFVEDDFSLGRFNGRLGRGVTEGEFIRSKKKRKLQEKDSLHRIQFRKECSRHNADYYKHQHSLKELNRSSFRSKEKDRSDWFPTRSEDMEEREQSPLELAISFKSNSLIAKAILAPSHQDHKSDVSSMDVNNKIPNSMSGSSSSKSSEDVVKTDVLMSGLDLPSDLQGTSKELLDKASVSGSGSVTADDASDLGVKNEHPKEKNLWGLTDGRTHANRFRKKRTGKRLLRETNLQIKNDSDNTRNSNDFSNIPSTVSQLNSDTALSKGNLSSPIIGVVPDTGLMPSLEAIVSDKGDISGDSYKILRPTLKRKRKSLTTLSTSYVADKVIGECSGHAVRHNRELTTDEGTQHAHKTFLANKNPGQGDSLGINQHAGNVGHFLNSRASELDAEKSAIESIDQYARLGIDRADDAVKHCFQDGLLENSFIRKPSRIIITVEGKDIACLSRPQESCLPEVQEDKYFSEIHESNSSSESDSALLQKPENVITSDISSADANSKEVSPNLVNVPQVGVRAEEFRSLGKSTGSDFLSADHKGIVGQFGISFVGALSRKSFTDGANLSHNIDSVEGSPDAMSHVKPCLSVDCSSKILRKRKPGGAHTGHSGSSTNAVIGTAGSISDELARFLAKDPDPDVKVGFLGDRDSCKEDGSLNEGPNGVEDSTLEVNYGANDLFPLYKKKRKVVSPRSNVSSFDCAKLDQGRTRLAEWGAYQGEDTATATASASASAAIKNCGPTDVGDKISGENFYVADLDENLADGNVLHMNDGLPPTLCAYRSGVFASSSGDELLAPGFDTQSCMSSPEELLYFSDFSRNTKASTCRSENEVISGGNNMPDGMLVSGDPTTFSLGKSLEDTASDNSQTNAEARASLPQDINEMVKKLNPVHGELALSKRQLAYGGPKVFCGHHPLNFGNSRKFHSAHVTKSRTWRRTSNNAVAVTERKLQPSSLPQSQVTKTAGTTQNSYIRKGNSLVRKPSPAAVSLPEFNGSSSSVYRLNACTDNLKSNQASKSKTCHALGPTVPRVERVNTSEKPKAQPLNCGGESLSCTACNSGESVPVGVPTRSGSPFKTSDVLEESMNAPIVPECQTHSVINSDSQNTLEGNMEKKIMYVKRRSNQLVAASNSDDTSMLGVDKTQASVSDGYYKSKKNQLLRASPENNVQKEDANANSCWLVSRTIIPRSSTRRQSFAKTYRHLKFSSVWKLHDTQSSEKHKNLAGPQKLWPHLFLKKATYWRSFMHALGTKPRNSPFSATSQKLLLSRKRGAIYTRSTHGYSLRMSKVLSVGGKSLKWSKSIERNSKKANEEATRAVAAAEKRKKQEKGAVSTASKSRNHVSRKLVLSVKLRPGERIFRIGLERYKMDSTRRTLHRITAEKESLSSVALQSEKNVKRSYVPRRLLIGNEEYVRIGNGNQLVRDPKKRTRILASEKVRWSLRTARLRLARRRKYCQFFTRFGKCNKADGKCPYIHDPSKIVVCTKFLNGTCSNPDCKLTHKVIPERMQDCSYFLKGSCSNENCPYRHVNVDPDSTVCESFLRGYCADGNECRKKHSYVCPAFEATGSCPQGAACKLHHPKKKTEKKPSSEQKIVRGRYFDGGLIGDADCSMATTEKLSSKGKDDLVCHEGKFPDYISLDVSDDEEMDHTRVLEQVCDDILPDAQTEPVDV